MVLWVLLRTADESAFESLRVRVRVGVGGLE